MKFLRRSLFAKFSLLMVMLFALLMTANVWRVYQLNQRGGLRELTAKAQLTGRIMAIALVGSLWDLDRRGAQAVLDGPFLDPDVKAVAVLDQAKPFASRGNFNTPGLLSFAYPIIRQGKTIGEFRLAVDTARAYATARHRAIDLAMLSISAMSVLLGLVLLITRSITRPIQHMTDRMDSLARGDLHSPIPATNRIDEIGRMAVAMQVFRDSMQRNVELKAEEDKLLASNAHLEQLARIDELTGLANRRRFDEALMVEFKRCWRDKLPLSLIMIDVDRFKAYNDTYGHQAGDRCLQSVAKAVRPCANRPADLTTRYGGEELAVILPGLRNENAASVAELMRLAIRDLHIEHSDSVAGRVTASFGVATLYPSHTSENANDVVRRADACLYTAKKEGRDKVVAEEAEGTAMGGKSGIVRLPEGAPYTMEAN